MGLLHASRCLPVAATTRRIVFVSDLLSDRFNAADADAPGS
jgi:hypothetical protein